MFEKYISPAKDKKDKVQNSMQRETKSERKEEKTTRR